jgi:hypothetical protein
MAKGRKTGGRQKGTPNKRTIAKQTVALERQEQAVAAGVTPLEVMIADMRFHHAAAIRELDRGAEADLAKVATSLSAARAAAKDAAPYIHPRLAAIEHTGKDGGPIRVTDAREQLAHLIALEAAASGAGEGSSRAH